MIDRLILKKEEKEKLVVKLAMAGWTTRMIAHEVHISLKDIGSIIRKYNGEELEYQNNSPTITSKALQMFKEGKNRVNVAIALNLESYEVIDLFHDYLKLSNMDGLMVANDYLGNKFSLFLDLFDRMKDEGILTQTAIASFVYSAGQLARLEDESLKLCEQIGKLNDKKTEIKEEIDQATSLLRYLRNECTKLE